MFMRPVCMRLACVASLLLVSCFDGGDAHGLPCNDDAECGNEKCIANICGGSTTSGTADTTADTTTDPTSGTPECTEPAPDLAACAGEAIGRAVSSYSVPNAAFGQIMSLVAGDFAGDDLPDLAVLSRDMQTLYIVRNDGGGEWLTTNTQLGPGENIDVNDIQPYDVAVGDLLCTGTDVFVLAGQGTRMGVIALDDEYGFGDLGVVDLPASASYSVTLADVVTTDGKGFLDAIVAGNTHVTVIENTLGGYDNYNAFSLLEEASFAFLEPWDVQVVTLDGESRILVPRGGEGDFVPDTPMQPVHSLRVEGEAQPYSLLYATPPQIAETNFENPWALAVGDFNADGTQDLAVAQRNLNDPDNQEGTTLPGTIRFLSIEALNQYVEIGSVEIGVGPNALAAADFDCDGFTDLVVGLGGSSTPPLTGAESQILFGAAQTGDMVAVPIGTDGMSSGSRIAIADFDGDGRPEAAIGDYGLDDVPGARFVVVDVN